MVVERGQFRTTKPKWLRKLERESWQAELIISGAAIIGSLQLPGLVDRMENYFLLNYDRDSLFICYIAAIYWRILANSLIATFIFHFVVRALWIGLVGLNSVFPGGFKANERFSKHFQDRMREEYGDVDGLIGRLDRLGSAIFGVAFAIAGVFLNFGLVGLLLIFVHSWLVGSGLTSSQVYLLIGALLLPGLLLSLLTMVGHTKSLRDTALVRRYQWPVYKLTSRFTYPLARRYLVTASNLVTSYYADSKGFGWSYLMGLTLIVVVGISSLLANDNTFLFIDPVYHRIAADSLLLTTSHPEEEPFEGIYFRPVLGGEKPVTAEGMTVWIPLPQREMVFLEAECNLPGVSPELVNPERQMQRRAWLVGCAKEYISLSLNDQPIRQFELQRQYRTN